MSINIILLLISYTLLFTAVFALVAFGGMFSERSGIINIGLEGIMVMGAIAGVATLVGLQTTPDPETMPSGLVGFLQFVQGPGKFFMVLLPILTAAIVGLIYSLLLAFASIHLKADQTIGGTALNILATALAIIFAKIIMMSKSNSANPQVAYLNDAFVFTIKFSDGFNPPRLEFNVFLLVALIALGLSIFVLYFTKFGLRMRSCGEHPQAAASLGVSVYKMRYAGVAISGALGGIGGLAFIIPSVSTWNFEVGVAGAGFLALSVMIFGQWKPGKIFLAALFFGFFKALANLNTSLPPEVSQAGFTSNIFNMLPFIFSILVLIFTSKNSRAPKAEGIPYDRGMR